MPRVANIARSQLGPTVSSHGQSPLKIPLNDDRQEKAIRFQSRHALHDIQFNQIKAAASPIRKGGTHGRVGQSSPRTPRSHQGVGKENLDEDHMLAVVPGHSMTPMKRMPILANFEEWMKMATDNKINATNSWNFALIDYFHDMSLLKEGDGVNFQKASCTLDGCVKIYTSRVDSVATETGKLLSGLADGANKKSPRSGQGCDEEIEDGDEDDESESGAKRRTRRKAQRSSETTLVSTFSQLQLRKFELELTVDPLFKKASADFDEGGAKGLLLNHLAIDSQGRIVFDSSDEHYQKDDIHDGSAVTYETMSTYSSDENGRVITSDFPADSGSNIDIDIDIAVLGSKYFPELSLLDEQDICPSLKDLDLGDFGTNIEIPLPRDPNDMDSDIAKIGNDGFEIFDEYDNGADDSDVSAGGVDLQVQTGFGDGADFWAQDAALESRAPVYKTQQVNGEDIEREDTDIVDAACTNYAVSLKWTQRYDGHEGVLSYFDKTLKTNWAGPEHWRIRRIKESAKADSTTSSKRRDKDPYEIDFDTSLDAASASLIHTLAISTSTITLPKAQWRSKTRNLLPDDKHFSSRQLLRLFMKPRAQIGGSRSSISLSRSRPTIIGSKDVDEAYWARRDDRSEERTFHEASTGGNYDANFFQDDCLAFADGLPDDDEFYADAREVISPSVEGALPGIPASDGPGILRDDLQETFGSHLVTQSKRLRPEYVQYARVAKKVDVRRLKEEMWKGIGFEKSPTDTDLGTVTISENLQFTAVMNGLQEVYPRQTMADISTSYCFICLLHLANEKGLTLENDQGLEELMIRRDIVV